MESSAPLPADQLLAHAEFVRRLARSLLRDASRADDVAQDTFVAALTQPRPRDGAVRSWLAGIVRNRTRMELRSTGRRERRERAAVRAHDVPTPDELVARLEIGRRLVDAVLQLGEPYRTTVFLRWFEDLTPTKIAQRSGVSVDTVKTRLRRALALLRDRLDGDEPGGRAVWCAALVPLARFPSGTVAGPALVGGASVTTQSKALIVAVALLGIFAGAAGRGLVDGNLVENDDRHDVAVPAERSSAWTRGPTQTFASSRTSADRTAKTADPLVIELADSLAPVGEGRVRGSIVTADGVPVAGARIVASQPEDPNFRFPEADVHRGFREWAVATVQAEARRRARDLTTTSRADGSFELTGFGAAPRQLVATQRDFQIEPATGADVLGVRAGATVDFVATPVSEVEVEVLGPGDSPVDEAVLSVSGPGTKKPRQRPWTPDEPTIRLTAGRWSIEAFARNGELAAPVVTVEAVPGGAAVRLVLRLSERLGIRGRVVDVPAEERAVFVHLLPLPPGADSVAAAANLIPDGKKVTTFGALDFRYRFDGVEPGRYLLGASAMGGSLLATREVTVLHESVWQDLAVPRPDDAGFVTVRVLDATGAPLADATVHLAIDDWVPPANFPSEDVRRGDAGTFNVRRSPSSGRSDAAFRLVVRSPSLGRRDIAFDPNAKAPVEVRFGATASLIVTVTGATSSVLRGHLALLVHPAGTDAVAAEEYDFDRDRRAADASRRVSGRPCNRACTR